MAQHGLGQFSHQVVPLALFPKLATCLRNLRCHIGLPYWHYQLVLSWYLHQPESHQLSFTKVSDRRTTGPIDRTPGTPGSDKKYNESGISIDELRGKWKPYKGVVDGFHNPSSCLRQSQSAQRARRTKSRSLKGLQLEGGTRRVPGLQVSYI